MRLRAIVWHKKKQKSIGSWEFDSKAAFRQDLQNKGYEVIKVLDAADIKALEREAPPKNEEKRKENPCLTGLLVVFGPVLILAVITAVVVAAPLILLPLLVVGGILYVAGSLVERAEVRRAERANWKEKERRDQNQGGETE